MKKGDIILLIIALTALIISLAWVKDYKPPVEPAGEIIITEPPAVEVKAAVKAPVVTAEPERVTNEEITTTEYQDLLEGTEQAQEQTAETEMDSQGEDELYIPADGSGEDGDPGRGLYLGNWVITAYCPCEECCGSWAYGATASGVMPQAWHTVAVYDLPFGTEIYIDGLGTFTGEDRGVGEMWVDVFVDSHDEALAFGMQEREVYLVE